MRGIKVTTRAQENVIIGRLGRYRLFTISARRRSAGWWARAAARPPPGGRRGGSLGIDGRAVRGFLDVGGFQIAIASPAQGNT